MPGGAIDDRRHGADHFIPPDVQGDMSEERRSASPAMTEIDGPCPPAVVHTPRSHESESASRRARGDEQGMERWAMEVVATRSARSRRPIAQVQRHRDEKRLDRGGEFAKPRPCGAAAAYACDSVGRGTSASSLLPAATYSTSGGDQRP